MQLVFQDHADNVAVCYLLFRHVAVTKVRRLRNKSARRFAKRCGVDSQRPVYAVHARQFFGSVWSKGWRKCSRVHKQIVSLVNKTKLARLATHCAMTQDGVKLLRKDWP